MKGSKGTFINGFASFFLFLFFCFCFLLIYGLEFGPTYYRLF